MSLDDALRRAQSEADQADARARAGKATSDRMVPVGVAAARDLLRQAVQHFEKARVGPEFVLRYVRAERGFLSGLRGSRNRYEVVARIWQLNRLHVRDDGLLYRVGGTRFSMEPLAKAQDRERAQGRDRVPFYWRVDTHELFGKAGLTPGDSGYILDHGPNSGTLDQVELDENMSFAGSVRLSSAGRAPYLDRYDLDASSRFAVSPEGTVFVQQNDYDNSWYEKLEDVIASAVVAGKR